MDVTFLGTGSAYPSPCRGASAVVLRTEGECWLFDCGEGTQTQFMKSLLKAGEWTEGTKLIYKVQKQIFDVVWGVLCSALNNAPVMISGQNDDAPPGGMSMTV